MANVSRFLQQMLNARYGKDVRQSIHDSINAINKQLEESDASALASAQAAQTAATEAKSAVNNIGTTVDEHIKKQTNLVTDDNFGEKANAYLTENPETEFLNVKKMGAKGDGITDDSACFTEGVAGYVVNDGVYCVDGATMRRLNFSNCIGNGHLKLLNPSLWGNDGAEKWYSPFDYTIAVKDLDNVLQKTMVSRSEADYYKDLNRKNATAMLRPLVGEVYGRTIGAVYKIQGVALPDNFTVCISNVQLYAVTKDKVLRRLRLDKKPKAGMFGFYELPWSPEVSRTIPTDKYTIHDDYTEFHLSASDFNGYANGKTESVLHFWGGNADLGNRDDIVGVISTFDFWVKEEEARDKLIIQIGVDQIDYNTKTIKQACSGIAMKLETYPRTQWSTSMNRELLDNYVDMKQLLSMRSLPIDNLIGNYDTVSATAKYEQTLLSMNNGDLYYKLFVDDENYRGYQLLNPVKHMILPYYSTSAGATGNYCRLFSIPKDASATDRFIFKIDYTRFTSGKVLSNLSAMLTIIKDGTVTIDNVSSLNVTYTGAITVVVTDTTIDVYAKGVAWGYVTVDVELLMYKSIAVAYTIDYDTDLIRTGAGAQTIMCDKWIAVDTANCTVVESARTSALEDRVAELENKISALTGTTAE